MYTLISKIPKDIILYNILPFYGSGSTEYINYIPYEHNNIDVKLQYNNTPFREQYLCSKLKMAQKKRYCINESYFPNFNEYHKRIPVCVGFRYEWGHKQNSRKIVCKIYYDPKSHGCKEESINIMEREHKYYQNEVDDLKYEWKKNIHY